MQQLVGKNLSVIPIRFKQCFREIKEYIFFEISAVRTGVYAYMDATQHAKKKNKQINKQMSKIEHILHFL